MRTSRFVTRAGLRAVTVGSKPPLHVGCFGWSWMISIGIVSPKGLSKLIVLYMSYLSHSLRCAQHCSSDGAMQPACILDTDG